MAVESAPPPVPSFERKNSFADGVVLVGAIRNHFGDEHPLLEAPVHDLVETLSLKEFTEDEAQDIQAALEQAAYNSDSPHHFRARQMLGEDTSEEIEASLARIRQLPPPEPHDVRPPVKPEAVNKRRTFGFLNPVKAMFRKEVQVELGGFGDANVALHAVEDFQPPLHSVLAAAKVKRELGELVHDTNTPSAIFRGHRASVLTAAFREAAKRASKPLDPMADVLLRKNVTKPRFNPRHPLSLH